MFCNATDAQFYVNNDVLCISLKFKLYISSIFMSVSLRVNYLKKGIYFASKIIWFIIFKQPNIST